jgi:hypothetical protein
MTTMQSILIQPTLAAADWVQAAIMLVAVFFGIMKLLFEASKNANKKPPPKPQPLTGPPKPLQASGQQADPLRSQVEEFLRRAGQPQSDQAQSRPQQKPAIEIAQVADANPYVRPALSESNRPDTFTPGDPSISKPRPAAKSDPKRTPRRSVTPKRRVTLAERAVEREEIRVGHLAEQPSHLGSRIIEEDKQFDDQLKAKFDHTVGTLSATTSGTGEKPASPVVDTPARQIAAMLTNPAGVQQAVIINEILRRPSDRW